MEPLVEFLERTRVVDSANGMDCILGHPNILSLRERSGYPIFVNLMPEHLRFVPRRLVEMLMAGIAVFMSYFGLSLAELTWFQAYPEFDYVRVGFVYSAIPGSGLVLLLFVIETAMFGPPEDDGDAELQRAIDHADHEQRTLD